MFVDSYTCIAQVIRYQIPTWTCLNIALFGCSCSSSLYISEYFSLSSENTHKVSNTLFKKYFQFNSTCYSCFYKVKLLVSFQLLILNEGQLNTMLDLLQCMQHCPWHMMVNHIGTQYNLVKKRTLWCQKGQVVCINPREQ